MAPQGNLMGSYYRHCSTCKTPIEFGAKYFKCSVSTCNQKRTGLFFCSVPCWDAHVPGARHRDAWAEPETAPLEEPEEERTLQTVERRIVSPKGAAGPAAADGAADEVLVVVSKLKKYIADTAEMNTSSQGMAVLSDELRRICDEAVTVARRDGRKTVLDRDFEQALRNLRAK